MIRDLKFLSFLTIIILQGVVIYSLFQQSLKIEGDIGNYLNVINNKMTEGDSFEPASMLLFKAIGLFPSMFHLNLLFAFCYLLSILESWVVFKKTSCSILWLVFFSIAVMPFAHAINIRTGFGTFFIVLFSNKLWALSTVFFFHASFTPFLSGWKIKISSSNLIIILFSLVAGCLVLYNIISDKLNYYFGYYKGDESMMGLVVELSTLALFIFLYTKLYDLNSKILWYRVFGVIILISVVSLPLPVISSRFVTLSYLIIVLIRLNSIPRVKNAKLNITYICFLFFFGGLILFRVYRVLTMFGYL